MFKTIITVVTILLSINNFSYIDKTTLNENNCKSLVSVDPNTGYSKTNKVLHFKDMDQEFLLQRKSEGFEVSQVDDSTIVSTILLKKELRSVRDFISFDGNFYLATSMGLLKFSHEGEYLSNLLSSNLRGIAKEEGTLFLMAGREGLIAFDLQTSKILYKHSLNTSNDNGHLSASVAVTQDTKHLFILMTGNSERGFNGILTFDKSSRRILNAAEYNKRKVGVIFPYAQIYNQDDSLYLNNGGWIHQVNKQKLSGNKKITPKWLAIKYSDNTYPQYIMLNGDLIFQDQEILGCGKFHHEGQRGPGSKNFSFKL
tara:strand:+ start:125341 stop:126279 length:939 start_codon:yes stop_codon:yes gene_type:complete